MSNKTVYLMPLLFLLTFLMPRALAAEEDTKNEGIGIASGLEVTQQDDAWKFALSPYMWATSLKGDSTIGAVKSDIDLEFKDIWDNLNVAGMVDFRAERGRWAVQTNLLYANLEADKRVGASKIDVENTLSIAELTGHYLVTDDLQLLAGARYYDIDLDIDVTGAVLFSAGGDESWVDPIVGAVYAIPLNDRFSLKVRGDVGGFGAGSDLSWQAWGLLECRLGKRSSIALGYRHLDWDYEDGSGNRKFEMDAYLTGPVLGLRIVF